MADDSQRSLNDGVTRAAAAGRRARSDSGLGDERTLGGDAGLVDTILEEIEVVDLQGRYTIERSLGQGGMGAVLLATDTRLGRRVAIKRILGEAAGNRMAVRRFLTEAKSIAALNHPHVVQIYEFGRTTDGPFLIMEYVDGGSLAERCKAGPMPLEEAVDLVCRLCDGLAIAHDRGIIHRDIKPANVLLTKDGMPKLTDFGLAKDVRDSRQMTMTHAVMGTPDFMPPEQEQAAELVDHRSDLWSLAATVYQMVTGRSPRKIRFDDVPAAIRDVLVRALEDRKDARYQSARELRDAFKESVRGGPPAPPAARPGGDLEDGQCGSCGTVNADTARKFCRNPACGASLRVPCLACDAQMPVWEAICGECGGNQPRILAGMRSDLEARRAAAEQCLAALAFVDAQRIGEEIAATTTPQLADLAAWGRGFVETASAEQSRQVEAAAGHVRDAEAHVSAFDYAAAIHALEAIPGPLRDPGPARLLDACRARQEESTRLIAEIAGRIGRKEIDGLLPLVERAVELRGDRADLATIRTQLTERRDARVARATAALQSGDARAAGKALAGAAAEDMGESAALLHRVRRAVELEGMLTSLVKEAKADGVVSVDEAEKILRLAEEYLAINPRSDKVQSLLRQCRTIVPPSREGRRRSVGSESETGHDDPSSLGDVKTLHPSPESASLTDAALAELPIFDLEARYAIERTIGVGGMGTVLLANDVRLGRHVAIKRMLGDAARDRTFVWQFLAHAKVVASVSQRNVVQIYDYGMAQDGPYLVMEYVAGGSLLDRCRQGPIPLEEACEIVCQLCDGLAAVHERGIIHRDIKPANVLLTRDGTPKLTDFGLAEVRGEGVERCQTYAGMMLGTPDFMSPEQRRDAAEVDQRSDLWSLAATVYQMVTGRSPKVIHLPAVPHVLRSVLAKALADEKEARYQSARELRDAIADMRSGTA